MKPQLKSSICLALWAVASLVFCACDRQTDVTLKYLDESYIMGQLSYTANPFNPTQDSVLCLSNVHAVYCKTYNADYYTYLVQLFSRFEGELFHVGYSPYSVEFAPVSEQLFYLIRDGKFVSVMEAGVVKDSLTLLVYEKNETIIYTQFRESETEETNCIYMGDYVHFEGDDHMQPKFVTDTIVDGSECKICIDVSRGPILAAQSEYGQTSELEGVWYNNQEDSKSLIFDKDGVLLFRWLPDSKTYDINTWGGENQYSNYILLSDSKMNITPSLSLIEDESKPYITSYNINGNVLTLDSFMTSANILYNFQLNRGEEMPVAALSYDQTNSLKAIFNTSNPLLQDYSDFNIGVIGSKVELLAICPNNLNQPKIDFEKQCIVFAPIMLSSINDSVEKTALWCDPENDLFEYFITIRKCLECYDAIDYVYAYDVYDFPKDAIKHIRPIVQIINKY